MTKKHFIALADAVRMHNTIHPVNVSFREYHLKTLADFCAAQNPHFNRERFLDYIAGRVGPNGGKIKS